MLASLRLVGIVILLEVTWTDVALKQECEIQTCNDINELKQEIKALKQKIDDMQSEMVKFPSMSLNNPHYQPEQLVFTFDHAYQANEAQDRQMKGFEHANRYYHIITPIEQASRVMYRF